MATQMIALNSTAFRFEQFFFKLLFSFHHFYHHDLFHRILLMLMIQIRSNVFIQFKFAIYIMKVPDDNCHHIEISVEIAL